MSRTLRIAIADDEELMRLFLEDMLPELGHEVVVSAQDGAELVQYVEKACPDLIITDIKMPRMDGVEAVARICRKPCPPVVFISGYGRRDVSIPDGVVYVFLDKPVEFEDIKKGIQQVISLSEEAS
jgi:CheY-like chemotaxis protein